MQVFTYNIGSQPFLKLADIGAMKCRLILKQIIENNASNTEIFDYIEKEYKGRDKFLATN